MVAIHQTCKAQQQRWQPSMVATSYYVVQGVDVDVDVDRAQRYCAMQRWQLCRDSTVQMAAILGTSYYICCPMWRCRIFIVDRQYSGDGSHPRHQLLRHTLALLPGEFPASQCHQYYCAIVLALLLLCYCTIALVLLYQYSSTIVLLYQCVLLHQHYCTTIVLVQTTALCSTIVLLHTIALALECTIALVLLYQYWGHLWSAQPPEATVTTIAPDPHCYHSQISMIFPGQLCFTITITRGFRGLNLSDLSLAVFYNNKNSKRVSQVKI